MKVRAQSQATPRYTLRAGYGAVVFVTKWDIGRTVYRVEDDGRTQTCSCGDFVYRHRICKHLRLAILVSAGRLGAERLYQYVDGNWSEAGRVAGKSRSPLAQHAR
jgi:hypothetical protein